MTELSRHLITHISKNFNVPNLATWLGWTQNNFLSAVNLPYDQYVTNPNPTLCTQYTYKFYQITLDHFKLSRINWLQHSHHVKDVPKTKKHGAFGDVKLEQKAQLLNTLCSSAVELEIFLPLPKNNHFLLLLPRVSC